jgi:hypothetical protein
MTDLSPATSAILDAYLEAFYAPLECTVHRPLAAALRALAARINGADGIRQDVLDIVNELESAFIADSTP